LYKDFWFAEDVRENVYVKCVSKTLSDVVCFRNSMVYNLLSNGVDEILIVHPDAQCGALGKGQWSWDFSYRIVYVLIHFIAIICSDHQILRSVVDHLELFMISQKAEFYKAVVHNYRKPYYSLGAFVIIYEFVLLCFHVLCAQKKIVLT
jgi:hypothetical protein